MIRDAGHEIGLHGYSHENPVDMTLDQQREILDYTYRTSSLFARHILSRAKERNISLWKSGGFADVLRTQRWNRHVDGFLQW
jgi:peptidoglycan/xylan/chitin deacetylase (PgdA/CDA1 family)